MLSITNIAIGSAQIRSAEHSPAQNQTVIAPNEDSEADPEPAAFAGTVDWEPSEADEEGSHRAFAATMIGDTANANKDQTDPASGRKDSSKAERRVAGYEVLDTLGRGGMGVVYRPRQMGLNRLVALKMILGGSHAAPEYLARFQAEAEAVAQLQHPNIVQIYDIGQHEGLPFFSLELIDGQSLEAERANRPMEPLRSAEIIETLARAMGYAHGRGIVHRDLKPANVLLTAAGVPKVTDFGLVKRLEEDSGQTATGTVMGTPSYMAPEQAWGSKNVGPLADVYSLGAILYALIDRPAAVLGDERGGNGDAASAARAGPAVAAPAQPAPRSGNHLPQMFAERPRQTLRRCRGTRGGPPAFSGERADPGPSGQPGQAPGGGAGGILLWQLRGALRSRWRSF